MFKTQDWYALAFLIFMVILFVFLGACVADAAFSRDQVMPDAAGRIVALDQYTNVVSKSRSEQVYMLYIRTDDGIISAQVSDIEFYSLSYGDPVIVHKTERIGCVLGWIRSTRICVERIPQEEWQQ